LRAIFRPGESRHAAKQTGEDAETIYSYATLRTYRQRANTLLNALPADQCPRWLRDLTTDHIRTAMGELEARGTTDAHIKTGLTALRKLVHGMRQLGWSHIQPDELVPDDLYTDLSRSLPRGGYSPEQAERLIDYLGQLRTYGTEFAQALRLLRASGLRHTELALLREDDLDRERPAIHIRRNSAKGGKDRIVCLPPEDAAGTAALHAALAAIPPNRHWLWRGGTRFTDRLQRELRHACDALDIPRRGLHGIRNLFAEEYLHRAIQRGMDEQAARRELSPLLGHHRVDVTYSYVPQLGGRVGTSSDDQAAGHSSSS
jgi:integrase